MAWAAKTTGSGSRSTWLTRASSTVQSSDPCSGVSPSNSWTSTPPETARPSARKRSARGGSSSSSSTALRSASIHRPVEEVERRAVEGRDSEPALIALGAQRPLAHGKCSRFARSAQKQRWLIGLAPRSRDSVDLEEVGAEFLLGKAGGDRDQVAGFGDPRAGGEGGAILEQRADLFLVVAVQGGDPEQDVEPPH